MVYYTNRTITLKKQTQYKHNVYFIFILTHTYKIFGQYHLGFLKHYVFLLHRIQLNKYFFYKASVD